ncbi:MAG: hypothetical protein ABFS56_29360, partial [Pseudomonadota bacterium]
MTDNFVFISVYIGLVIAAFIKGIPKNPIDNFLALLSSQLKKRQKGVTAKNRRYIVQLVQDSNLFIMETMKTVALSNLFFLIFIIFWILPMRPFWLFTDLAVTFFGLLSIWIGSLVSQKLSLLKQAYELYQEEKEIESEIDPEQDET